MSGISAKIVMQSLFWRRLLFLKIIFVVNVEIKKRKGWNKIMQQSLDDIKSELMARMGNIRDASSLVSAMINAGIIKPKDTDEVVTVVNGLRNRFHDWVFEDIDFKKEPKEERHDETESNVDREATEKMKRATWGVIFGDDGDEKRLDELNKALSKIDLPVVNRFTLTKAKLPYELISEFLEKYMK